jgi:uncharacterized protein YggU (UPF0235/DUF167 family)
MPGPAAPTRPWCRAEGGLSLQVRLTPKGGRDALEGIDMLADGRAVLRARVRAVPEDGKANAALLRLVAEALGLPISRVSLVGGATSRLKTLRIEADATPMAAALEALASPRQRS